VLRSSKRPVGSPSNADLLEPVVIRASAQPQVVYEAAVLKNAKDLPAAYAFLTRLIRPRGQRLLVQYCFS